MTLKSTASVAQVMSVMPEDEWVDAGYVAQQLRLINGRQVWTALIEASRQNLVDYWAGGPRGKGLYRKRES